MPDSDMPVLPAAIYSRGGLCKGGHNPKLTGRLVRHLVLPWNRRLRQRLTWHTPYPCFTAAFVALPRLRATDRRALVSFTRAQPACCVALAMSLLTHSQDSRESKAIATTGVAGGMFKTQANRRSWNGAVHPRRVRHRCVDIPPRAYLRCRSITE